MHHISKGSCVRNTCTAVESHAQFAMLGSTSTSTSTPSMSMEQVELHSWKIPPASLYNALPYEPGMLPEPAELTQSFKMALFAPPKSESFPV